MNKKNNEYNKYIVQKFRNKLAD